MRVGYLCIFNDMRNTYILAILHDPVCIAFRVASLILPFKTCSSYHPAACRTPTATDVYRECDRLIASNAEETPVIGVTVKRRG